MATIPNERRYAAAANLLQEGVSCALATLSAIEGADLLRVVPADKGAAALHTHAAWLLAMLEDQLTRIQQRVDELDAERIVQAEG
jgi:hypothetical protein